MFTYCLLDYVLLDIALQQKMDNFLACTTCGELFESVQDKLTHVATCGPTVSKQHKMDTISTAAPQSINSEHDMSDGLSQNASSTDTVGMDNIQTAFGVDPDGTTDIKLPKRRLRPDSLPELREGSIPTGAVLQDRPDATQEMIKNNWVSLRSFSHKMKAQSCYNIRLIGDDISKDEMNLKLKSIFHAQNAAFKVNASVGSLLNNRNSGRLRYFHSSYNNHRIFDTPFQIQNLKDFQNFTDKLNNVDLSQKAIYDTESSEWTLLEITNITIFINHLSYPIQANSKTHKRCQNGVISIPSQNNLCFFACLAAHYNDQKIKDYISRRKKTIYLKRETLTLYKRFTACPENDFTGVEMERMTSLENKFHVGIQIYTSENSKGKTIATLVKRANPNFKNQLNLLLSETDTGEQHFSYIYDLKRFSHMYKCSKCGQLWGDSYKCNRHASTCDTITKEKYPAGFFKVKATIFEKIEQELGLVIPEEKRYFPYFITYDFESYMVECNENFQDTHIPMSFSLCSNLPGLTEPVFRTHPCPEKLVSIFLDLLNKYSEKSYSLLLPQYQCYLDQLNEKAELVASLEPIKGAAPSKDDKPPKKKTTITKI